MSFPIVPLTTTFTIRNAGASSVNVKLNGSPVFDVATGATSAFTLTFTSPTTFEAVVSAEGGATPVSKTFVIVVQDPALADQMFKSLWSGMNNALIAGNKATALTYLSAPAQTRYGPVFDVLMPHMAGIVATYGEPQFGTYSDAMTEYAIGRTIDGVRHVFLIYFVRDLDGVWRLDSM